MKQEPLDFGRRYSADADFRESLLAMADAINEMSLLVAAGASGIDDSDLTKMLTPGSSRHFRFRGAFMIGSIASFDLRRRIATPFNRALGFAPPEPAARMTPEQELAKYRETVARMAPAIADLADKEIGR